VEKTLGKPFIGQPGGKVAHEGGGITERRGTEKFLGKRDQFSPKGKNINQLGVELPKRKAWERRDQSREDFRTLCGKTSQ